MGETILAGQDVPVCPGYLKGGVLAAVAASPHNPAYSRKPAMVVRSVPDPAVGGSLLYDLIRHIGLSHLDSAYVSLSRRFLCGLQVVGFEMYFFLRISHSFIPL